MKTDTDLRQAVIAELGYEPSVTTTDIGVEVDEGHVTLTGTVAGPEQRAAAERAAERVEGIRGVNCELRVSLTDHGVVASN
jgi:osmotically-inducible protein OsmY